VFFVSVRGDYIVSIGVPDIDAMAKAVIPSDGQCELELNRLAAIEAWDQYRDALLRSDHEEYHALADPHVADTVEVMRAWAGKGCVHAIRFCRAQGCPWSAYAARDAAHGGHLETLVYLHDNGCPWDTTATAAAAHGGHLEALAYLHENGCPWGDDGLCEAAHSGHFEIVRYMCERGCPLDVGHTNIAAMMGRFEILRYLVEQGCPLSDYVIAAAANGQHASLDVVQHLHRLGCSLEPAAATNAAADGNVEILQYLHANGCLWEGVACRLAVRNRQVDVLAWLDSLADGCPCGEGPHTVPV
jgi:hypothetical protein